ncbi:MAG: hypothetical protein U0M05_04575 [Clostridia bacterium]|jgi:hypothetical protein|nr:hypothetical protein [Clostridia bacterium]MEE0790557.1 hypothetical protein [Clostridia bacterium]HCF65914.1 hypothetical protein [Clostridiales bacterium]HJJ09182.1 hypothetical protein [Clostridiaceae bacterium]
MKNKKIIIICLIMIILAIVISLGVKLYLNKDLENQRQKLQETQEKYGWVEKETVDVLVAKFNTEIVDSSSLNPASTDYLTEDNNQYWYGLIDGIYLVVVPEKYTGDKSTEIVDYTLLYVDKTSKYESDAISYIKHLIKANNSNITDNEIDSLLQEAKVKSTSGETANNGKGISIGYIEKNDSYQFQVLRSYK